MTRRGHERAARRAVSVTNSLHYDYMLTYAQLCVRGNVSPVVNRVATVNKQRTTRILLIYVLLTQFNWNELKDLSEQ
jgi:hypothetical protein